MNDAQRLKLDMNVASLLDEWPQVIAVFLCYRMACVGCNLSTFETLGDALKIYQIAPEVFLDELQRAVRAC